MSQRALPPQNMARLAITSFCTLLRHYGITMLEPELVRQAKFDGPVCKILWRALHDVVLVLLAGCPAGPVCQAALSRQWNQISTELSGNDDDEFPHEGAVLVLHQLATWDVPPGLIQALGPGGGVMLRGQPDSRPLSNPDSDPGSDCATRRAAASWPQSCRSRPLLLALGWIVAAAGLFEKRITELEPGPELRNLLPPYPQDTCASPAVQNSYDGAVWESKEHVQKLNPCSADGAAAAAAVASGRSAGARGRGDGGGGSGYGSATEMESHTSPYAKVLWADVEAAAQRAVMLCGRVRSRLVSLQAATDCRNKLLHSLWARQAAAAPASRPLTPYELQLCAQPANMQRHMTALETATLALLEQQELVAHSALFYEWLGSVIGEEQQYQRQRQSGVLSGHHGGGGDGGGPGKAAAGGQANRIGVSTEPGGSGGELASLKHLPYICSDAGARLAAHLQAQLEAAISAAAPELSAARCRTAPDVLRRGGASGPAAAASARPQPHQRAHAVTMEHFLALAEQAIQEQQLPGARTWLRDGGGDGSASGGQSALPLLVGSAVTADDAGSGPWRLPDDLAAALGVGQDTEHRWRYRMEEDEARFQQLRHAALARYDFGDGSDAAIGGPSPALLGPATIGIEGPAVAATAETQRLIGIVLATARPLARTRATHKAALMAAMQELPEGYFLSGM